MTEYVGEGGEGSSVIRIDCFTDGGPEGEGVVYLGQMDYNFERQCDFEDVIEITPEQAPAIIAALQKIVK